MNDEVLRVCIYLNEEDRYNGQMLWRAVLDFLKAEGCAGATVFRGVAGFGGHKHHPVMKMADPSSSLPLLIDFIESAPKVESLLPRLDEIVREGLITLQEVHIYKYTYRREPQNLLDTIQVGEVMTPSFEVVCVERDATLFQAVEFLLGKPYEALPVVDTENRVVGIVTDGDISNKGGVPFRMDHLQALSAEPSMLWQVLSSLRARSKTVAEIMTTTVVTVRPQTTLLEAGRIMYRMGLKRLPVVDDAEHLVGIFSRYDWVRASTGYLPSESETTPKPGYLPYLDMRVEAVMEKDFPQVRLGTNLRETLAILMEARSHRAIVVDDYGRATGMLTEGDIISRVDNRTRPSVLQALRRKLGFGGEEMPASLASHSVDEVAKAQLVAVTSGTSLAEAARTMAREGVKRLPVLDPDGRPMGVLTRRGIMASIFENEEDRG